jgi:hypothetical protein
VHKGEVLLLDSGVTLYGSLNPANYQVSGKPTCGTVDTDDGGCKPLITVSGANAGVEAVRASSGSQGRIDGRGDLDLLGTSTTWWDLATQAKNENEKQNNPRMIQANSSNNFTLYDIDLLNSPNFHVTYRGGTGFTVWGVRIKTPADARNTDGIDPGGATDVTIKDSWIQDGDDGIAIKGGSPVRDVTIAGNHFYGTHGISIGSETAGGVTNVLVENNTVAGTDSSGIVSGSSNGIRIESSTRNGGKVTDGFPAAVPSRRAVSPPTRRIGRGKPLPTDYCCAFGDGEPEALVGEADGEVPAGVGVWLSAVSTASVTRPFAFVVRMTGSAAPRSRSQPRLVNVWSARDARKPKRFGAVAGSGEGAFSKSVLSLKTRRMPAGSRKRVVQKAAPFPSAPAPTAGMSTPARYALVFATLVRPSTSVIGSFCGTSAIGVFWSAAADSSSSARAEAAWPSLDWPGAVNGLQPRAGSMNWVSSRLSLPLARSLAAPLVADLALPLCRWCRSPRLASRAALLRAALLAALF